MNNDQCFIASTLFEYYKSLADKALAQVDDEHINWKPNESSNSLAIIVHHMSGNMLSRFTDFLTTDGEKAWRNRETEFEEGYTTRAAMLEAWEKGWQKVMETLGSITDADLDKVIYIRNEGHTVMEALQRQLAHYSSHVGQIIYIAKMIKDQDWQSLSIPKGKSQTFNDDKFSQEKGMRHFTDKR